LFEDPHERSQVTHKSLKETSSFCDPQRKSDFRSCRITGCL